MTLPTQPDNSRLEEACLLFKRSESRCEVELAMGEIIASQQGWKC